LIQVPELPKIEGLKSQNSLLVCHSKDTVFVQELSKGLEDWIEKRREHKFEAEITAFTFDHERLYVALKTKKLVVYSLDKLALVKTVELGDECTEIIEIKGMLILALKEKDYWCITAELIRKLIRCPKPLT
jgi:hypothetical protein